MHNDNGGWFDRLCGTNRRAVLTLIVVSLLSFLPGFFTLPAVDRDEARFAQASRQMVATGDWIDIRLQDQPRYKKPVGIYWLQSAFVAPLGTGGDAPIWVHRLPSLIGATIAVLLTYWTALPLVGRPAAFLAGAAMAVSLILGVEARLAKTDAVLLATIILAEGVLARAFLASRTQGKDLLAGRNAWLLPLLFWTAIAAGTLVKGPVIFVYVGLTAAALAVSERSAAFLRLLRPMAGIAWFCALTLPWFIAIGIRTDGDFYRTAIGLEVAGKIVEGQEGHGAPPLTHFAMFWATFWPGSLLFALALGQFWRQRREPWLRFLCCWAIPSWIVFELVSTKLPHYVLPAFPAIAIAMAGVITTRATLTESRIFLMALHIIVALVSVAGVAAIAVAGRLAGAERFSAWFVIVTVLAVLAMGTALRCSLAGLRNQDYRTLAAGLFGGMIGFFWLVYPSLARIESLWPSAQVAGIVASFERCDRPYLVSAGYEEASLVFSTRTDILLTSGTQAANSLARHPCALAFVEKRQLALFLRHAERRGLDLDTVGPVSGFNIGSGHLVEITAFAARPSASD